MLSFRNLSADYRIGFATERGRPAYINLRPGEVRLVEGDYMKKWKNEVKEEVAAYVEKGVLEVYDDTIPGVLTISAIIAYS